MSQYKIEAGTAQHIGDRQEQQDRAALFAAPRAPGYMMAIVADGMGVLSGGALAADDVIRTAKQLFDEFSPLTHNVEMTLKNIVDEAHTVIKLSALSSQKQPHSTVVALILTPEKSAVWTHVGDSRLYRFDGSNCAERTIDHSHAESLVREGVITRQEAPHHHLANVLVNALGTADKEPYAAIRRYDGLKAGDAFLLCSDGLWHYFADDELGAAIAVNTPRQASEMLIKNARQRAAGSAAGNCTLAIVKLVSAPKENKHYPAGKLLRAV